MKEYQGLAPLALGNSHYLYGGDTATGPKPVVMTRVFLQGLTLNRAVRTLSCREFAFLKWFFPSKIAVFALIIVFTGETVGTVGAQGLVVPNWIAKWFI